MTTRFSTSGTSISPSSDEPTARQLIEYIKSALDEREGLSPEQEMEVLYGLSTAATRLKFKFTNRIATLEKQLWKED